MQMVYFQKWRGDDEVLGLPIEAFFAHPLTICFGCAYLEGRCASPGAIMDETWEMSRLLEDPGMEKCVLECLVNVLGGNLRPMQG